MKCFFVNGLARNVYSSTAPVAALNALRERRPVKIAVSQRMDVIGDRGEVRDALDGQLSRWLDHAGMLSFPVPNMLSSVFDWLSMLEPDAIVLSGGNDIGAASKRDDTERNMLAFAGARKLPVLGICRGMQMMAVYAGGRLKSVDGHVRTRHMPLALHEVAVGEYPESVNSYHHWSLDGAPPGYRITATSSDGEIEAMRHQTLPWVGWMWHPEREIEFSAVDIAGIKRLVAGY